MLNALASRVVLTSTALLCFAAAFALMPSVVRSRAAIDLSVPPVMPGERTVVVATRRDPFVPLISDRTVANPPNAAEAAQAAQRRALAALFPRLPNAVKSPAAHELAVRAVVLGAQPAALIDLDGRTSVVLNGDELLGSAVAAIEQRGVRLRDGRTFVLDRAGPR